MTINRRDFMAASVAGAALLNQGVKAFATPAGSIQVGIDATKVGAPVSALIFGGYMEPATTRVWAEMLTDRKFGRPITDVPQQEPSGFFRRMMGEPFKPVGPSGTVDMDTRKAFVGKHSARIKLDSSEPHGIAQSKLRVGRGRSYVGRIYLAGDAGAKVVVRLIWGSGAGDSQTIQIPALSAEYKKFPLKFTSQADTDQARFEILGTGSGMFNVGTASLMPTDNVQGFNASMVKYIKDVGFLMAKWPGGNFVSGYDWYDGLGDPDKRPPKPQAMWSNRIEPNDVGINEFIQFCRLIGAEPDVAVNTGFGEPRVAAELVEYCNGSVNTRLGKMRAEHGHPEPYNVRQWTIGNEMYGPWQFGYMPMSQYTVKHNYFVEAMRKVDPKIKVASAGASICEESWCAAEQKQMEPGFWQPPLLDKLPFKYQSKNDSDWWLLKDSADYIDYISEHTYCYPDMAFDAEKQMYVDVVDPLQLRTRRMANRIGAAFEAWQYYTDKMPSLKSKNIKITFDEWGCRYHTPPGSTPKPVGMVTALSYAVFLHEMFRHSDMIDVSCPTGGLNTLLMDATGQAVGLTAEALVMKLIRTHFVGALPIAVSGNSPQVPMRGTPMVDMGSEPVGSATYPIDVLAALSGDRKTFILSVINATEEPQEFTPQINGVKLRSAGRLSQLAAPSATSNNEVGKEPVVKIAETAVGALPAMVQLPPVSVSIYRFDIA
jgi:alpha-L-arabinofuranosidase